MKSTTQTMLWAIASCRPHRPVRALRRVRRHRCEIEQMCETRDRSTVYSVLCAVCVHEDRTYRVQGQQRGRGGFRRHGCKTKSHMQEMWAGAGTCRVAAAAGTAGRYCRPTSNFFADAQLQILNLNLPVDSLPLPAVSDDSAFPTSSFRQPLAKIDSSDFHLKRTGGVTAAAGGARRQRLPDQQLRHQVQ